MPPKNLKPRKQKMFWQTLYGQKFIVLLKQYLSVSAFYGYLRSALSKILKTERSLFVSPLLDNASEILMDIRNPTVVKISGWKALFLLQIFPIALFDGMAIAFAWIIAQKVGTPVNSYFIWRPNQEELGFLWLIVPINLCMMIASGIYGSDRKNRSYLNLFKAICLAQVTVLLVIFLLQPGLWISRSVFVLAWGLTLIVINSQRILLKIAVVSIKTKFDCFRHKVLLLGTLEDTTKVKQLINSTKTFKIQGAVDLSICQDRQKWKRILNQSSKYKFDEIFLCSWEKVENPILLSWELKTAGIDWRILAVDLKLPEQCSEMVMLGGMPTIRFCSAAIVGVDFWCKRIFDLLISSLLLTVLAFPLLLIATMVKLDSPGAIFYKQNRVGLKGRYFKVWKFRTMAENAHELQAELEAQNEVKGGILFKIKEDPRITRVGRLLRRYSLDELPQLINVLRGEMSLVGPRPLPLRDVAKLAPYQLLRHEVLPGITGLWQVSGRSDTDSEEIFNLDFVYIQNWSLILDWQILLKTIQVVTSSKGAY
ncbi:MAG TPA: sugar transferase [Coleofasciculaceae cyanobacterium]|jgi:exopolysaccharide biosynthesis polyprenyl glycosylphosphotransferase